MAKKKQQLYPGVAEAESIRSGMTPWVSARMERKLAEEPDFIVGKPNYDKFKGWSTEKVLVWLNID